MQEFPKTKLNQIQRLSKRGQYDKATVFSIVDEALICHVGFTSEGQTFVIPTIHARVGDTLYFHGAVVNRMLKHVQEGNRVCITVTLVDGIVFARSVFHHSMNYRSAMIFGKGRVVDTDEEKEKAFFAITEHVAKGRWDEARKPNAKEKNGTLVVAVEIETASAKIRTGPPLDDEDDYTLPVWAGVLPILQQAQMPERDAKLDDVIPLPEYIKNYKR